MNNPNAINSENKSELLHIAITRPLPQGKQLQQKLQAAGFASICEPLFTFTSNTDKPKITQLLKQNTPSAFIFVSSAAVSFAEQAFPIAQWQQQYPQASFFAVGDTTKSALLCCHIKEVISPEPQNSEGLLALAQLQQVADQHIIIVRGDHGREHLATQLIARGAKVEYLASYQKIWLQFNNNELVQRWQNSQINCIVVTSVAILKKTVQLLSANLSEHSKQHWQNNYYWLVAGERIAAQAQQLQLQNIIVAANASDQAIITSIRQLNSKMLAQ